MGVGSVRRVLHRRVISEHTGVFTLEKSCTAAPSVQRSFVTAVLSKPVYPHRREDVSVLAVWTKFYYLEWSENTQPHSHKREALSMLAVPEAVYRPKLPQKSPAHSRRREAVIVMIRGGGRLMKHTGLRMRLAGTRRL